MFAEVSSGDDLARAQPAWLERSEFACWTAGPSRVGWVLWGHTSTDVATEMKELWLSLVRRLVRPYDHVLDLRTLDDVSRGAFELIREGALARRGGLQRHVTLVGDTPPGAVQVGLFSLAPPDHEWRAVRTTSEAAAWLGWPDGAAVLAAVDERIAGRLAEPAVVATLRRQLRAALSDGRTVDIDEAARELGMSRRALQRALTDAGTSFSEQKDKSRIDLAMALLSEPAAKLDAVAAATGFADTKGLLRLFRRVTGKLPAQFRDER
jgi:AraC-like DNA-binding protein